MSDAMQNLLQQLQQRHRSLLVLAFSLTLCAGEDLKAEVRCAMEGGRAT